MNIVRLQQLIKRIIDIVGSPIFFTQDRVGKDGKVFNMIKFRSMLDSTNKWGDLLEDEERLTSFSKKIMQQWKNSQVITRGIYEKKDILSLSAYGWRRA